MPARQTQITKAVLALREAIFDGDFPPGDRMPELHLVDRLGISRTPVRLALGELEHEGLLRVLPGGGYVVREFTEADISDAIELRGVLEGTAARFAAERGADPADLAELHAINARVAPLVDRPDPEAFETYIAENVGFHARLLAAAGSPLLERSLASVVTLPFAGPNAAFVRGQSQSPSIREIITVGHRQHTGLVAAIERRHGARAESLAREHAQLALTQLQLVIERREMLRQLPGGPLIAPVD